MEELEPRYFDDAEKFLNALEELSSQQDTRYVYRGQRIANWPLLPVAHRNNYQSKVIDDFVDRNVSQYKRFIENFKWKDETEERFKTRFELALRYYLEAQLIYCFHETALEWEILEYCSPTLGKASCQRIKHYLTSCEIPYRSDSHPLEVQAQLHGVPTKRLDVSGSYQAAIYYALSGMSPSCPNDIVVWAFGPSSPLLPKLYVESARSLPGLRHRGSWNHQMLVDPYSDRDYYCNRGQRTPFERKLAKTSNYKYVLSRSGLERLRREFVINDPFPFVFGIPIFEPLSKVLERINHKRGKFNRLIEDRVSALKINWEKVSPDEDWQHLRRNTEMVWRHKTKDYVRLKYSDGIRYTYLDSRFDFVYGTLFADVFSGESVDGVAAAVRGSSWIQTHHNSDFLVYQRTGSPDTTS